MSVDTKLLAVIDQVNMCLQNLFFVDLHKTTLELRLKDILLLINKESRL